MTRLEWIPAMVLLLHAAFACAVLADEVEEDPELAALLAIVAEETEIATKQKMNSDFVPGIVTVLHGSELEALGATTVLEALALVPGVQPAFDALANPSLVVRGIDFPFNSGNVKLLVDGVALTRESAGLNGSVMLIPVEQVERIEVIRGPGSVVYGDFAFMGLVNIVTRKSGRSVFVGGDPNETLQGGVRASWGDEAGWNGALNVAAFDSGDTQFQDPRTAEESRTQAFVSVGKGGFSLSGKLVERDLDETTDPPLPGPAGLRSFDETTWAVDARYAHELSGDFDLVARLARYGTELRLPAVFYDDEATRVGVDLTWKGLARQSWLASVEYANIEIAEAGQMLLMGPGLSIRDVDRNVLGVTLQGRFDVSDAFSITAGARFDDYSDLDESRVTPRLAVVWRVNDRHIVKGQYAEGFRAPTFFELYGGNELNSGIDFEVNATTELNYVYRNPTAVGRITLFHSDFDDMIFPMPRSPTFSNSRDAESQGVEAEWSQQVTDDLKIIANASWTETEDDRSVPPMRRESLATPDWMGILALLWNPTTRVVVSLTWHHVGDREASEVTDAYDLVGVTVTGRDVLLPGLELRAGLKNLLDDEATYIFTTPGLPNISRYSGRTIFGRIAYTW